MPSIRVSVTTFQLSKETKNLREKTYERSIVNGSMFIFFRCQNI